MSWQAPESILPEQIPVLRSQQKYSLCGLLLSRNIMWSHLPPTVCLGTLCILFNHLNVLAQVFFFPKKQKYIWRAIGISWSWCCYHTTKKWGSCAIWSCINKLTRKLMDKQIHGFMKKMTYPKEKKCSRACAICGGNALFLSPFSLIHGRLHSPGAEHQSPTACTPSVPLALLSHLLSGETSQLFHTAAPCGHQICM